MHKPITAQPPADVDVRAAEADATPTGAAGRAGPTRVHWRSGVLAAVVAGSCAAAAYYGNEVFLDRAAAHHLELARLAHFSAPPDPVEASTEYLLALRARPALGEAHYFLAHLQLRERQFDAARTHFAAALRDLDGLPAARRPDAMRMLSELDNDREPAPLHRPLDTLAVSAAASAPTDGALVIPTEPTAAGVSRAARKGSGKVDIVAVAELAERNTLAAQRPEPSPDMLFADGSPAIATLARRLPASSDIQREVTARLDALFADDTWARLSSASALTITPALNSDTVPAAVERAEAGLLHQRNSPAVADATRVTLGLLQSASPLTLALNRPAILRLTAAAAGLGPDTHAASKRLEQRLAGITRVPRPVVYIQIAHEAQRPLALQLATQLAEAGWLAPELEVVGERAPARTEVRSQGSSHQGLARWVRRLASESSGTSADLNNLRRAAPEGDVYEVWLDKDLCVAPNRLVPDCQD